jgi:hypothetical protein
MKHRLKSVDRLLGNNALHAVRADVYQCLVQHWLQGLSQLLIVVDWSDLSLLRPLTGGFVSSRETIPYYAHGLRHRMLL